MARTAYAIPEWIDRLPVSGEVWLVLAPAQVAWLVETFAIGLGGNALPSLQQRYAMDPVA